MKTDKGLEFLKDTCDRAEKLPKKDREFVRAVVATGLQIEGLQRFLRAIAAVEGEENKSGNTKGHM